MDTNTWILYGSTLAVSLIFLQFATRFSQSSSNSHWFFEFYSILLRQGIKEITFPSIFIAASAATFVLLAVYEFYITAELAVPSKPEPLSNLQNLLASGYRIHYTAYKKGLQYTEEDIRHEFVLKNLSNKLNMLVKLEENINSNVLYRFSKADPTFAYMLWSFSSTARYYALFAQNAVLRGKFHCFLVQDVVRVRRLYDMFSNALGDVCRNLLVHLKEGGVYGLWKSWDSFHLKTYYLRELRNSSAPIRLRSDYITLTNLQSVFIQLGVLLCIASLVLVYEMTQFRVKIQYSFALIIFKLRFMLTEKISQHRKLRRTAINANLDLVEKNAKRVSSSNLLTRHNSNSVIEGY